MATDLLSRPTKCLLVRPEFLQETFYNMSDIFTLLGAKSAAPPLGLLIVAALLPKHWQLKFVDGDIEPITDAHLEWADIVLANGIGPQEHPMLELVRRAKAKGKTVIVGGSGPTLQPGMYTEADVVVVGEGEDTVPQILEALNLGAAAKEYRSTHRADLNEPLVPRYDLARVKDYMMVGVGYSRGCPFSCEFCAQIEIFGKETRTKPAEQVIAELQTLYDLGYRGQIDFGYDNLIGDLHRVEDVLVAMREWSKAHGNPFFYSTEATINLARHPRLMELMRDNDFRYLFVGIESADDDVLKKAHKNQNTATPAAEAVKTFNSYGFAVLTGLILGFDGETDKTAQNILDMVQATGAFPTLVLPLHALPNTALSRRLQKEGRLFEGDLSVDTRLGRTDTATTGLNFKTDRPRTEILADLAHVLEQLYDAKNHYARLAVTTKHLRPKQKYRPGLVELLYMGRAFLKIASTTGLDKSTRGLFWRALGKTLLTNPRAADTVIAQAAMHTNYAYQSQSYVRALREQIAIVESVGETRFNEEMLGHQALPPLPPLVSTPPQPRASA